VIIGILQALDFNSRILVEKTPLFVSEVLDSKLDSASGEYLPANADTADYIDALTLGETSEIHEASRYYNSLTVSLSNHSADSDFIEVPLINYPGYRAVDVDTGIRLNISDGKSKRVKVEIPGDYSGTFTVRFVSPWYWRAAEAISLVTVVALVGWRFSGLLRRNDGDGDSSQ
jgi:hypothetical protein